MIEQVKSMMNVRELGLALFGQDSMRLGYQIERAQLRRGQGHRSHETNGLRLYGESWFDAENALWDRINPNLTLAQRHHPRYWSFTVSPRRNNRQKGDMSRTSYIQLERVTQPSCLHSPLI